jgi:hypothetical protein
VPPAATGEATASAGLFAPADGIVLGGVNDPLEAYGTSISPSARGQNKTCLCISSLRRLTPGPKGIQPPCLRSMTVGRQLLA